MVVWVEGGESRGREVGSGCLGPEEDLPWDSTRGKGEFHAKYSLINSLLYLLIEKQGKIP